MAKKRVHELAKQYDMPMPEVVKRLQSYGIEVKAAATAVDEKLADAALTGKPKPKAIAGNGAAKPAAQPVVQQRAGFGHGTARAPQAVLHRFATVGGRVVPDPGRRLEGRGAWVHHTRECFDAAVSRRGFQRALRGPVTIPKDTVDFTQTWPRSASTS